MIEAFDLEACIFATRGLRSTVMPRFSPPHWWECDICEVTPSGYFREYELKTSRGDFFADAKKERTVYNPAMPCIKEQDRPVENKHALLAAGDTRGPANFFFVTPEGLLKPEDLPPWAGLIEVWHRGDISAAFERMIIPAPRLHRTKAPDNLIRLINSSCYGRLHHLWAQAYYRRAAKRRRLT